MNSSVGARFELHAILGQGGMGVVYDAYDREREMRVALKRLRNVDAASVYRFKREFRALRDLSHPNIIDLYELMAEGDDWYLTMEHIDGENLIAYVRAGRTFEPPRSDVSVHEPLDTETAETRTIESELARGRTAGMDNPVLVGRPKIPDQPRPVHEIVDLVRLRSCLEQLAHALYALHSAGMVHRDLKPSNVFVTREGRTVLMDFGVVTHRLRSRNTPDAQQIVGTPAFMAPEQIRGHAATAAADWYAFGVLMYLALAGQLPYVGPLPQMLRAKVELPPHALAHFVDGVPADLEELCMRLMARAPEERPRGQEILDMLGVRTQHAVFSGDSTFHGSNIFIGRTDELATLHSAYQRALEGSTTCVIVEAPSGMGKTSLLERFLEELADPGQEIPHPLVLKGRCQENENLSYKAFDGVIDALSNHLLSLADGKREALTPPGVHALTRIFPVLQRIPGWTDTASLDDLSPADRRVQAVDALRGLLDRMAESHPVILRIDDIHWADRDSVRLLLDVLEPPVPKRLLLLCAMRSDTHDDSSKNDISAMVAALEERSVAQRITLGPLRENEQRALIRALALQRGMLEEPTEFLWYEAEGHPMLLAELVWYAMEAPEELPRAAGLGLEDVMYRRVARLPESARVLLEILAVAGEPLPLFVLADAGRIPSIERERGMAILRITHLTRTVRKHGNRRWLDVYHDKVRETVLSYMTGARSRSVHRALARAMEHWPEAKDSSLARHWLASGDTRRAVRYLVTAAQRAMSSLAVEHAAQLFRAAGALMEDLSDPGAPDQELEIMRCRSWIGLVQTARSDDNVALSLALLDNARRAALAYHLVAELATIHVLRGNMFFAAGHLDQSLEEYRTSHTHAQRADSAACEAQSLGGMGHAYFMRGDIGAAEGHYNRCIELARKGELKGFEVSTLPARAITRYYQCDIPGALADARSALADAVSLQLRRVIVLARSALGFVLLESGQLDEARYQLDEAADVAHRSRTEGFELALSALIGKHLELLGRPREGAELIERGLEESSTMSIRFAGSVALGALALLTDDPSTRTRALARGEDLLDSDAVGHGCLFFYRDAIDAMHRAGDADAMMRYADLLHRYTHEHQLPWGRLMVARGRALARHVRGRRDREHRRELERLHAETEAAGLVLGARAISQALDDW